MRSTVAASCLVAFLALACGEDEIPQEIVEATKPADKPVRQPVVPPLTPSAERFEGIPIPSGAKHRAMLDGRFRYLIEVTPGEMIGYFKKYALPASVELEGAATVFRDSVAKESKNKKKMDIVIRPSTSGWTQIEITPEAEPAATQPREPDVLNAAEKTFRQAR